VVSASDPRGDCVAIAAESAATLVTSDQFECMLAGTRAVLRPSWLICASAAVSAKPEQVLKRDCTLCVANSSS